MYAPKKTLSTCPLGPTGGRVTSDFPRSILSVTNAPGYLMRLSFFRGYTISRNQFTAPRRISRHPSLIILAVCNIGEAAKHQSILERLRVAVHLIPTVSLPHTPRQAHQPRVLDAEHVHLYRERSLRKGSFAMLSELSPIGRA